MPTSVYIEHVKKLLLLLVGGCYNNRIDELTSKSVGMQAKLSFTVLLLGLPPEGADHI